MPIKYFQVCMPHWIKIYRNCFKYYLHEMWELFNIISHKLFFVKILFLLFKKSLFSPTWKAEQAKESERVSPSICWFTSYMPATTCAGWGWRQEPELWIPHVGGMGPGTWTTICCLPGCFRRNLESEVEVQGPKLIPVGDAGVPSSSLTSCASKLTLIFTSK